MLKGEINVKADFYDALELISSRCKRIRVGMLMLGLIGIFINFCALYFSS